MLTLTTIACFIAIFIVWFNLCNNKTRDQRANIINSISRANVKDIVAGKYSMSLWDAYDEVSYNRHLYALVCFRDPNSLYPESIRKLFND